ncbi:MAG: DNA-3-methyladenine glycosylase [Gammaproteobacteria bacterium]|nr:DNA-3-methyladenine glycosylase [Gammaproteobacteria bacterium]
MSKLSDNQVLPREFYRQSTVVVARGLLGCILASSINHSSTSGRIVEVEAYLGSGDAAAHSANGPTPRTRIQWGPPGHAYVYLIYGMYCCLNFITEPEGTPGCVLIRAIEPVSGIDCMIARRNSPQNTRDIGNGPGKLTQALAVTRRQNGTDLTTNPLCVHRGTQVDDSQVVMSPRIGIVQSTDLLLRFFIRDNEFVTKHSLNQSAKPF